PRRGWRGVRRTGDRPGAAQGGRPPDRAVPRAEPVLRWRAGGRAGPVDRRGDGRRGPAARRGGGRRVRRPPSLRLLAAALLAVSVAAAAGCGGSAGDLLLVQRFGSIPRARLDLRVTEDGRVSCNRGPLRQLTSAETLTSRGIADDLTGKHDDGPA